ncbi:hypothetical protein L202_05620 [Cryptococcus amylolentus CBS 6039]|uniref:Alpha/beta hydrolase fold-3 domain-containing protein n=2 Tax=Cryptococcus amylolentus TaxID=104669 RepID=A0A1E3HL42_9TREE|nr:hypothetical protein L202_05620 [Cryptococcus amylolentus CBS 6039]ODN77083.1 hypothetical protein L202_05620 [Cryptococcus amylolentus CBS 6039]ODO04937.1 hypothetical protein I350_05548 [Cryptococcus amylolentus CBS 6273]
MVATSLQPKTFTYDTSLDLKLDVYLPTSRQSTKNGKVPAFVHFHGGGMVTGSRNDAFFPEWINTILPAKGFLVVSADYRLLFPSTPADMVTDVHTLFSYLSTSSTPLDTWLSSLDIALDAGRFVVSGQSGGNYPARAAATNATVTPRPITWLSLFGQGSDWLSDFWLSPQNVLPYTPFFEYDQTRAKKLVEQGGGKVVSDSAYLTLQGGKVGHTTGRNNLYIHFAQTGLYVDVLLSSPGIASKLGTAPYTERLSLLPPSLLPLLLPITASTPPTYIIHGTSDHMVPIADSYKLKDDLEKEGVQVRVDWVEGAEHGLLADDFGGLVEGFDGVVGRVVKWLEKRVN